MRGKSKAVPGWVPVLLAAEEWNTPPWEIEQDATQEWWERWRAWSDELSAYKGSQEKRAKKNG